MKTSYVELWDIDFKVVWEYYPASSGSAYEPPEDEEFWIESLEYDAEVATDLGFKPEDFDGYDFLKELFKELKKEMQEEYDLYLEDVAADMYDDGERAY